MLRLFFSILLLIPFIGELFYALHYDRKHFVWIFPTLIISLVFVNMLPGFYSAIAILPLVATIFFWKKFPLTILTSLSMSSAIITSFFLLNVYVNKNIKALTIVGVLSIAVIAFLGIYAIFEEDIKKFFIYSNFIQLIFVMLDLSIAKLKGEIGSLGTIQIFNYVLAGSLLFITLSILSRDDKLPNFNNLEGLYYKNPLIGVPAVIAAASLAGLPGLNLFVSRWLLFKESFTIDPIITVFEIFTTLMLFLVYFKIIYILIIGPISKREKGYLSLNTYAIILAVLCIIFGLIPQLQFYLLEKII
ncbi:hypothetical protein HY643_01690 [Candidatus Woesearchaeota archaeon]|nr:hypothetical protein [Candidatus Woesearchaeota archaeon]